MKWYGIEVSKFCGANVSSKPQIIPMFSIPITREKRRVALKIDDYENSIFKIKVTRKIRETPVININTYDSVMFSIPVTRKTRSMIVIHIEED